MWTPVFTMALLAVESAGTEFPPRVEVDIDPQVMLGIGDFCDQGGDVIGCSPAWGALGVRGAIGWLPNPAFSVGVGGGYFWLPNDSIGVDNWYDNQVSKTHAPGLRDREAFVGTWCVARSRSRRGHHDRRHSDDRCD